MRRPIVRNTARMTYYHVVKGNWGTAVKTSASYNWRRTRPNSNYNSGSNFVRTDHPLKNMEDRGIFDSGCSGHMTGNKDHLDDFEECKGGSVTFGGSKGYITGKGRIKVGNLEFDSVSFVKELGHFNLFSISQICDKQHKVLFTETECLVVSPDFKMPDENQVLLKVPRQHNMYSFDMKTPSPAKGFACLIAKATSDESKLWHRRLGHINFKNLNKLVKGNLVRGLPSKVFRHDHTCVACQKGKQHRASCKAKLERIITEPLHTLHMDLFGPTSVKSINHASYCLVITDDCTKFSWVFFLATKDETSGILQNFIRQIENQINHRVKIIRSDNGTEFKNRDMLEFYGNKGIKQEYSNARTPQQNGVAERMNRTLIEAARTMLADSLLPTNFWAEAVNTACYIFISVLGKFDGKSNEGFLVGYSLNSKAYRVYNLVTKRVEVNLHVNFHKDKPNVKGVVPKLTNSAEKKATSTDTSEDNTKILAFRRELEEIALKHLGNVSENTTTSTPSVNTGSEPVNTSSFDSDDSPMPELEIFHKSDTRIFDEDGTKKIADALQDDRMKGLVQNGSTEINEMIRGVVVVRNKAKIGGPQGYCRKNVLTMMRFFLLLARLEAIGLQVKQNKAGIFISQDKYVAEILKKFDLINVKTAITPMETKVALIKDEEAVDVDVTPKTLHLNVVKRIFNDYGGSNLDRKSITGGCQFLGQRLISWQCKKQTIVATSTTEAEYVVAANCCGQTATANTIADGTLELNETIDTTEYTITEASIRDKLHLEDASGITMLPNSEILKGWGKWVHHLLHCIRSKSGGWDQFGSNIATALIYLSTGRVYNFSKLIFDGMVTNLKSKTKFLMYPRFLQLILDIQTENKHPYLAVTLTKKIFGNMKRGFRGAPRPLLAAMLLYHLHPLPPSTNLIHYTNHILASIPIHIPATDPEPMEHTNEEPSPAYHHFSPLQKHAQEQMSVDDLLQLVPQLLTRIDSLEKDLKQTKLTMGSAIVKLVKKVKKLEGMLKRKNVVFSDSEEEEPVDQGREILNVDSLKVDLVVIQNTCSKKEESNSETASSKLVKECNLNSETKDVHAIKYKMSKEKERCMAYFRSLHSHLQVLSKDYLKGTHIEHGFKRAFMSIFGQDVDTFTRTMLLNVDQLQKQLDKDEFQEDGSMTAFWVVNKPSSRSSSYSKNVIRVAKAHPIRPQISNKTRRSKESYSEETSVGSIFIGNIGFSPNKTSAVYEKTSSRSDLRWKPTGYPYYSLHANKSGLDVSAGTSINVQKEQSLDLSAGEEQVEDISPNTLEAAKTLSRVASQKPKSIDKGRRYKRRKETKGKKVVTSLDFQEEVNTGAEEVNIAEGVNTGSIKFSTVSGQVSTDSITKSIPSPDKGQREGKCSYCSLKKLLKKD
ncbi:putative ribonuclease H-like domain-containing protein [Tanacetum coccineum]